MPALNVGLVFGDVTLSVVSAVMCWHAGPTYPTTAPDTNWSYTDRHGHAHRWQDGKLPTLQSRSVHVRCDGSCNQWDCDGWDEIHYNCRRCGALVQPRWSTRWQPGPGTTMYELEVGPVPVAPDRATPTMQWGHQAPSVLRLPQGDLKGTARVATVERPRANDGYVIKMTFTPDQRPA